MNNKSNNKSKISKEKINNNNTKNNLPINQSKETNIKNTNELKKTSNVKNTNNSNAKANNSSIKNNKDLKSEKKNNNDNNKSKTNKNNKKETSDKNKKSLKEEKNKNKTEENHEDDEYEKYIEQSTLILNNTKFFCVLFEIDKKSTNIQENNLSSRDINNSVLTNNLNDTTIPITKVSKRQIFRDYSLNKVMKYLNSESIDKKMDWISVSFVEEKYYEQVNKEIKTRKIKSVFFKYSYAKYRLNKQINNVNFEFRNDDINNNYSILKKDSVYKVFSFLSKPNYNKYLKFIDYVKITKITDDFRRKCLMFRIRQNKIKEFRCNNPCTRIIESNNNQLSTENIMNSLYNKLEKWFEEDAIAYRLIYINPRIKKQKIKLLKSNSISDNLSEEFDIFKDSTTKSDKDSNSTNKINTNKNKEFSLNFIDNPSSNKESVILSAKNINLEVDTSNNIEDNIFDKHKINNKKLSFNYNNVEYKTRDIEKKDTLKDKKFVNNTLLQFKTNSNSPNSDKIVDNKIDDFKITANFNNKEIDSLKQKPDKSNFNKNSITENHIDIGNVKNKDNTKKLKEQKQKKYALSKNKDNKINNNNNNEEEIFIIPVKVSVDEAQFSIGEDNSSENENLEGFFKKKTLISAIQEINKLVSLNGNKDLSVSSLYKNKNNKSNIINKHSEIVSFKLKNTDSLEKNLNNSNNILNNDLFEFKYIKDCKSDNKSIFTEDGNDIDNIYSPFNPILYVKKFPKNNITLSNYKNERSLISDNISHLMTNNTTNNLIKKSAVKYFRKTTIFNNNENRLVSDKKDVLASLEIINSDNIYTLKEYEEYFDMIDKKIKQIYIKDIIYYPGRYGLRKFKVSDYSENNISISYNTSKNISSSPCKYKNFNCNIRKYDSIKSVNNYRNSLRPELMSSLSPKKKIKQNTNNLLNFKKNLNLDNSNNIIKNNENNLEEFEEIKEYADNKILKESDISNSIINNDESAIKRMNSIMNNVINKIPIKITRINKNFNMEIIDLLTKKKSYFNDFREWVSIPIYIDFENKNFYINKLYNNKSFVNDEEDNTTVKLDNINYCLIRTIVKFDKSNFSSLYKEAKKRHNNIELNIDYKLQNKFENNAMLNNLSNNYINIGDTNNINSEKKTNNYGKCDQLETIKDLSYSNKQISKDSSFNNDENDFSLIKAISKKGNRLVNKKRHSFSFKCSKFSNKNNFINYMDDNIASRDSKNIIKLIDFEIKSIDSKKNLNNKKFKTVQNFNLKYDSSINSSSSSISSTVSLNSNLYNKNINKKYGYLYFNKLNFEYELREIEDYNLHLKHIILVEMSSIAFKYKVKINIDFLKFIDLSDKILLNIFKLNNDNSKGIIIYDNVSENKTLQNDYNKKIYKQIIEVLNNKKSDSEDNTKGKDNNNYDNLDESNDFIYDEDSKTKTIQTKFELKYIRLVIAKANSSYNSIKNQYSYTLEEENTSIYNDEDILSDINLDSSSSENNNVKINTNENDQFNLTISNKTVAKRIVIIISYYIKYEININFDNKEVTKDIKDELLTYNITEENEYELSQINNKKVLTIIPKRVNRLSPLSYNRLLKNNNEFIKGKRLNFNKENLSQSVFDSPNKINDFFKPLNKSITKEKINSNNIIDNYNNYSILNNIALNSNNIDKSSLNNFINKKAIQEENYSYNNKSKNKIKNNSLNINVFKTNNNSLNKYNYKNNLLFSNNRSIEKQKKVVFFNNEKDNDDISSINKVNTDNLSIMEKVLIPLKNKDNNKEALYNLNDENNLHIPIISPDSGLILKKKHIKFENESTSNNNNNYMYNNKYTENDREICLSSTVLFTKNIDKEKNIINSEKSFNDKLKNNENVNKQYSKPIDIDKNNNNDYINNKEQSKKLHFMERIMNSEILKKNTNFISPIRLKNIENKLLNINNCDNVKDVTIKPTNNSNYKLSTNESLKLNSFLSPIKKNISVNKSNIFETQLICSIENIKNKIDDKTKIENKSEDYKSKKTVSIDNSINKICNKEYEQNAKYSSALPNYVKMLNNDLFKLKAKQKLDNIESKLYL